MAFTDNFNRANENLEASANWTHDGAITGAAAIVSNRLVCTTSDSTGSAYKAPNQGSSDHYVQYTIQNVATSSGPFIACRLADRNNFIGIRNGDNWLIVYRRVAGSLTLLWEDPILNLGDTVRFECQGSNWTAKVNGTTVQTGAIGDASLTSSGTGLVPRSVVTSPWIDDFETGALGSSAIHGTLSQTIDPVTLSASGSIPIKGQVSASVGEVSLAAGAKLLVQGSLSQTIGPVGLAATGTISLPPINGALSATIGEVILSAQGGNTQRTPGGGYYRPVIYLDREGRPVNLKAHKARTENQAIQAAKNAMKELPKEDRPEARQAVKALQEAIEAEAAEQVIERSRHVAEVVGELKGLLHQLEEIARQEAEDDDEAAMLLLMA